MMSSRFTESGKLEMALRASCFIVCMHLTSLITLALEFDVLSLFFLEYQFYASLSTGSLKVRTERQAKGADREKASRSAPISSESC